MPVNRPAAPTQNTPVKSSKIEAFNAALILFEKDPARREAVRAAAPAEFRQAPATPLSRAQALLALKNNHESQAGPAHTRIHPSWRKALLAKQTASVARAVASPMKAPSGSIAEIARDAAQVLTFERLVGDLAPTDGDEPVLRLFQGDDRQLWLRRIVWAGRLKRAIGSSGQNTAFQDLFRDHPAEWAGLAASTLARFYSGLASKARSNGHLGLVTVASLASRLDLRRRQWVLQHLSMEFGPLLATWLRLGKPPWPDEQIALENWIADQACQLAGGLQLDESEVLEEREVAPPVVVAARPAEPEPVDESVELLQTISNDSALFDLEIPGLDELELDEDESSFHLGDLNL